MAWQYVYICVPPCNYGLCHLSFNGITAGTTDGAYIGLQVGRITGCNQIIRIAILFGQGIPRHKESRLNKYNKYFSPEASSIKKNYSTVDTA